jgi:Fic family protein
VLFRSVFSTSGSLVEKTGITPATVNKALGHLEQLGIIKELTAQKRNRLFSYAGYIELMSRGTELPGR